MGLNPKAPAWTPGPSSSGDRQGGSLGRIRKAVHGVGTHKSVDGAETLGVGGLNLPMKKDKHRANLYSHFSTKEVGADRTRHCWIGCRGQYEECCMPTMLVSCPDRQQG